MQYDKMKYDNGVFLKYRELAIKEASELVVGNYYYSNMNPDKFKVAAVLTGVSTAEMYALEGEKFPSAEPDNDKKNWLTIEFGKVIGDMRGGFFLPRELHVFSIRIQYTFPLAACNVGEINGINPWLIFADEDIATKYYLELGDAEDKRERELWEEKAKQRRNRVAKS